MALSLADNENDAEEITQEAFCRAFRSIDTFRGDSSFFTWIYRITLNVGSSYMKQRRMKIPLKVLTEDMGYSLNDIFDENPSNDPETLYIAKEVKLKCLNCLTTCLPGEQRKIFCLAITIGLPYKQVVEEISELRNLRDIYKALHPQDIDKYLADRINEGIGKKEWTILNKD